MALSALFAHAGPHESDAEAAVAHAAEAGTLEPAVHESGIHIELSAERLGSFAGIPVTNTLLMSWAVVILLVVIAFVVRKKLSLIPGRFQTLLELAFGFVYDYVAQVLESRDRARRFFPLLMTIFLFVFTANILEFTPGIGSIGFFHANGAFTPLLRSVNTDLNTPLMLAIISFLVIEVTGIMAIGVVKYSRKFFNFSSPINFAIGIIEFIGEWVRIVSLSFRLFGNILAGEVIIVVATFFLPYIVPVPLMLFEVFIGFLQAAIFALLTLFFIKLAIAEPHGEAAH